MPSNTVSISAIDRHTPGAAPAVMARPRRQKPLWKRMLRSMRRRPGKAFMLMLCTVSCGAIAVNALYLQKVRHPAPFLAGEPTTTGRNLASVPELQLPPMRPADLGPSREMARGTMTKEPQPPRESAIPEAVLRDPLLREMAQRQPQPVVAAPAAEKRAAMSLPTAPPAINPVRDPIAELINGGDHRPPADIRGTDPARPVAAAQRALMKLGYGVPKADGRLGDETRSALGRFERDRNIAVTRDLSPRTVRELASASGLRVE